MASEEVKTAKKKVALNVSTYNKLKDFSRFNGLKLRLVLDTFVELLERDETFRQEVVSLTLAKEGKDNSE